MSDDPLVLTGLIALVSYFGWQWWGDLRAWRAGTPNRGALPGATTAPAGAVALAAAVSLAILGAEVGGEYALGIVGEQSRLGYLLALYTLFAAFVEELIFRGLLWDWASERVGERLGTAALAVVLSLVFALLHPFLWEWKDGGVQVHLTVKAWFSTAITFVSSLWFYWARLAAWNPERSLIPPVAAHLARNAGVIVVKGVQGFLG
ncbi:MAG: CPBP family intramembrane glutamic endopeptidase [Gemmatimonadales bacterium]|nr:CPBP family intramembrane glutamic endopeptidase [Gemmatimonadales bacterium]